MTHDKQTDRPRRRVTVIDIARHAGVSKSTVSLVLRSSPLVKAETRRLVERAIDDLGYVYNRGAANLRQARSNMVGMVINDLANPFFAELAVGIERVFQGAGYVPFIANTAENPMRQAEVLRALREQGVAGLIVCPSRNTPSDAFKGLVADGVPVVQAMRKVDGARAASIVPDNRRGGQQATEHLLALGHRRIAFLGGYRDTFAHAERSGGYRQALEAAGVGVDPALIIDGPPNRDGGEIGLARALALPNAPTAALCFNDVVAFGVLAGLRQRGLTPGVDFAVVGFDDVTDARHASPPLTTVAVDSFALGERAAQAMLRMVHGDATPVEGVGDVHLVVRESCGAGMEQAA
ncbi:MAG: LacI family DNA-binding transcriptional regulator [Pseudomonadota bacterium]